MGFNSGFKGLMKLKKIEVCAFTLLCLKPRFCTRHCTVPAVILFDHGIIQTLYFSDKVPG